MDIEKARTMDQMKNSFPRARRINQGSMNSTLENKIYKIKKRCTWEEVVVQQVNAILDYINRNMVF